MMNNQFYLNCAELEATLKQRLAEKAPGRIQLVSGPRQVGKTTTLLALAKSYGEGAIYATLDGPEAAVTGFWERLWARAERIAKEQGSAVVLLDEIQHLTDWSSRLKSEWDRIARLQLPIHVVASGSSSLHLAMGSKESLAGRFEQLTIPHWNPGYLAKAFGLSDDEAVDYFVSHGSYPGAVSLRNDPARWLAYVRDAILEPAIGKDILALRAIRRPALLRQIFSIAATIPAQIISLQKLQGQLQDKGALATIAHYLEILEEGFLVAGIHKFTNQPFRQRESPPKMVVLNQAICAALDPRGIPTRRDEPDRFGWWVENACLAYLLSCGRRVLYWREEPYEVDAILDDGPDKWAIEIKTGAYQSSDLKGLLEFTKRYPDFRPLVLCDGDQTHIAERMGLEVLSWRRFLLGELFLAKKGQ